MLKYVLIFFFFVVGNAFAADSAIDFSTVLVDLSGPALDCDAVAADGKCSKTIPLTLGRLCSEALSLPVKGGLLSDSIKRGSLALKVFKADKISLTAEEIQLIEKALPEIQIRTVVLTQAIELLDPALIGK